MGRDCFVLEEISVMATSNGNKVDDTLQHIKDDAGQHSHLNKIHDDINTYLRSQDTGANGKLNVNQFRSDLKTLTQQMHTQGILPQLDLVSGNNGNVSFAGISGDGKADGKGQLATKAHGDKFQYDSQGHLVQFTDHHGK